MQKTIKCLFGEEIIISQRRRREVATIKIVNHMSDNHEIRLTSEDHLQIIEALLWGLDIQDKHRVIMSVIETMPDFIKQQYAPADKRKRR